MKVLIALVAFAAVFITVDATAALCETDSDCDHLGKLYCIKGGCKQGICSCPRGFGAKFLSSEKMLECVPLKKVGESCSTDGNTGMCAAMDSWCNNGWCECRHSYKSVHGGEMCRSTSQKRSIGEICSTSLDCDGGVPCQGSAGSPYATLMSAVNDELMGAPPVCGCSSERQKIVISNQFSKHAFPGKKVPSCEPREVGDYCFHNNHCPSGSNCTSGQCTCNTAVHVLEFNGASMSCVSGRKLASGGLCAGLNYVAGSPPLKCDGSLGLYCGDYCDITDPSGLGSLAADVKNCAYLPWMTSGSKATVGKACEGDLNCKSLGVNPNGICVSGKCENAGVRLAVSLGALLCAILGFFMMQ